MNETNDRGKGWVLPTVYRKSYANIVRISFEEYRSNIWTLYTDVGEFDELEITDGEGKVVLNKKIKKK